MGTENKGGSGVGRTQSGRVKGPEGYGRAGWAPGWLALSVDARRMVCKTACAGGAQEVHSRPDGCEEDGGGAWSSDGQARGGQRAVGAKLARAVRDRGAARHRQDPRIGQQRRQALAGAAERSAVWPGRRRTYRLRSSTGAGAGAAGAWGQGRGEHGGQAAGCGCGWTEQEAGRGQRRLEGGGVHGRGLSTADAAERQQITSETPAV